MSHGDYTEKNTVYVVIEIQTAAHYQKQLQKQIY